MGIPALQETERIGRSVEWDGLNLDYSCVIVARVLRWRQIEVFEQIAPDREVTGKLPIA
jgi:hypothetical protein